ncbi:hypothetical protein P153DRAFT_264759, partial [Dothidotthia symphoricarpi CBS 119687]
FFEGFYRVTDNPDAHEQHIDIFTNDAKIIIGWYLKFRLGMMVQVASRSHDPKQIFAFSEGSDDLMAYGTVGFEFNDGRKETADSEAHCHFTKADGHLNMVCYQVYL